MGILRHRLRTIPPVLGCIAAVVALHSPTAVEAQNLTPMGAQTPAQGCAQVTGADDERGHFEAFSCSTGVTIMAFEPASRPASLQALVESFVLPRGEAPEGLRLTPWPEDLQAPEGGEGWKFHFGQDDGPYMLLTAAWATRNGRVISCSPMPLDPPELCVPYLERALRGQSLSGFEPETTFRGIRQRTADMLESHLQSQGAGLNENAEIRAPRLLGTDLLVPEGCRSDSTRYRVGTRIGCPDSVLRVWSKDLSTSGAAALRGMVERTVEGTGPGQIAAILALEGQPFDCALLGQRATCLEHQEDGETARIAYRLAGNQVIIASCARRPPHDTWDDLCAQVVSELEAP